MHGGQGQSLGYLLDAGPIRPVLLGSWFGLTVPRRGGGGGGQSSSVLKPNPRGMSRGSRGGGGGLPSRLSQGGGWYFRVYALILGFWGYIAYIAFPGLGGRRVPPFLILWLCFDSPFHSEHFEHTKIGGGGGGSHQTSAGT